MIGKLKTRQILSTWTSLKHASNPIKSYLQPVSKHNNTVQQSTFISLLIQFTAKTSKQIEGNCLPRILKDKKLFVKDRNGNPKWDYIWELELNFEIER